MRGKKVNVISLNKYISNRGIIIKSDDLSDFLNSNVRITIEKIDELYNNKGFLSFAGSLNNNDTEILERKVDECREIDFGTWQ